MEYPPGMLLLEKDLCAEFKVSRTPLREAIQKLREMRLVTVIPRYGTHVSSLDINEIRCAASIGMRYVRYGKEWRRECRLRED